LPYLAKSPREMFTQLLSQPPIALNKARAGLDFGPRVETVIMRGLSREPGDRYPDVLTFARELKDALLEAPGTASAKPASPGAPAPAGGTEEGLLSRWKGLFRRG
jgi:serine/threonine-protein kinase